MTIPCPSRIPFEAGGNHVIVDIGGGRYAFYAHLQPDSVDVEVVFGHQILQREVVG